MGNSSEVWFVSIKCSEEEIPYTVNDYEDDPLENLELRDMFIIKASKPVMNKFQSDLE